MSSLASESRHVFPPKPTLRIWVILLQQECYWFRRLGRIYKRKHAVNAGSYLPVNQVVIRIVQLRVNLIQVPSERLAAQALAKPNSFRDISVINLKKTALSDLIFFNSFQLSIVVDCIPTDFQCGQNNIAHSHPARPWQGGCYFEAGHSCLFSMCMVNFFGTCGRLGSTGE